MERQQLPLESITLTTMITQLIQAASRFNMSPELGSKPGVPLSAALTALYFVVAPVGIFLFISVVTYAFTRERKEKTEPKDSVLTHIE